MKIRVPKKIELALRARDKRYIVYYGGRGAAKSMSFAQIFISMVENGGFKIGCLREYQNSIDDSVYSLIKSQITELGVSERFDILKSKIDTVGGKGGFRFKGFQRDSGSIKSSYGFNICWVEEGQTLSELSIRDVFPSIREEGSQIWISANPVSALDPFSKRFVEPYKNIVDKNGYYEDDDHLIVKINYDDNPFFPDVLERERLHDYETLDRAEYDHKWLGEFLDTVDNSIIKKEWFDSCVDAHKKLGFDAKGVRVVSHDPADTGGDSKAICDRHGSVIKNVKYLYKDDINTGCDWALDYAIRNNADQFIWDGDGVGLALQKQVKESLDGKKIKYSMFKGSESPERPKDIYDEVQDFSDNDMKEKPYTQKTNEQTFRNKRAQHAWMFRDRIYNTYLAVEKGKYIDPNLLISIESTISELVKFKSEVCRIPRVFNSNGLIQIMAKPKMKQLKIESPGGFDSAMMSFDVSPAKKTRKKLQFDSIF